jgi:putative toxin-antitoxin system antitoxin component (TIGR02293 family)
MSVEAIVSVLAPPGTGRLRASSTPDLIALTRRGMPASILTQLAATLGVDRKEVAKLLHISERTLSRRMRENATLTAHESDRAVRLARILAFAGDMIGNPEKAARWLQTPNIALEGSRPIELLDTDTGVEAVRNVLGRIAYGVYS